MATIKSIPDFKHWAIITDVSVYIPADERSRTNPGHGYPASTETHTHYEVYESEVTWKAAIQRHMNYGNKFKALAVTPATVTTTIEVKLS